MTRKPLRLLSLLKLPIDSKVREFHKREGEVPPKELYPVDWESIYKYELVDDEEACRKAILLFWWCSEHDQWGWFDFDEFFKSAKYKLRYWIEGFMRESPLTKQFSRDYTRYLKDDLSNLDDVLDKAQKEGADVSGLIPQNRGRLRKATQLYRDILAYRRLSTERKAILVDRVIHFTHQFQRVWGADPGTMRRSRKEYERYYG